MKKKTIVWAAAALAAVVLAALAGFGFVRWQAHQQKLDAAREKLYLSWESYIDFRNEVDFIQGWTMEHVARYGQDKTWENLLKARAALAAGSAAMQKIQAPEMKIERSVTDTLPNDEVILVTQMLSGAPTELQAVCGLFENLKYTLEHFFLYDLEDVKLADTVAFYQKELELSEQANAYVTNHLLLAWRMQDRWEKLAQQYPAFGAYMGAWENRDSVLEAKTDSYMDEMEKLYYQYENVLMYSEIMLEMTAKAQQSGNYDELMRRISFPEGVPVTENGTRAVFPTPFWMQEPRDVYYAVHAEDESIRLIDVGDALEKAPTAVYDYYDHVTREEYEQYFAWLRGLGYQGILKDGEDGSSMMLVVNGEYALAVQWTQFETVLTLSDPLGCLVSPLDYDLLNMMN